MSTSLLPNETFFLYQNLRLQIESARLAVLRGDTGLLQDSLVLAASWLEQYFDNNSAAVVNAINVLNKMKDVDLEQQAPNLDASLDAINKYIEENQTSNIPDTTTEQL